MIQNCKNKGNTSISLTLIRTIFRIPSLEVCSTVPLESLYCSHTIIWTLLPSRVAAVIILFASQVSIAESSTERSLRKWQKYRLLRALGTINITDRYLEVNSPQFLGSGWGARLNEGSDETTWGNKRSDGSPSLSAGGISNEDGYWLHFGRWVESVHWFNWRFWAITPTVGPLSDRQLFYDGVNRVDDIPTLRIKNIRQQGDWSSCSVPTPRRISGLYSYHYIHKTKFSAAWREICFGSRKFRPGTYIAHRVLFDVCSVTLVGCQGLQVDINKHHLEFGPAISA